MDMEDKFAASDNERTLELQMFRERWREELAISKENIPEKPRENEQEPSTSVGLGTACIVHEKESRSKFEIAAEIFREGIKEERSGRLYEAVRLYRRAIQLDPDIEFKFEKSVDLKKKNKNRPGNEGNGGSHDEGEEQPSVEELLENLMAYNISQEGTCQPNFASNTIHISCLPFEIIHYLTQWIVSSELDMLSLEQFARVCRGFYRVARDDAVWRMACHRIWGVICGRPEDHHYGSWREMLTSRPQVRFNGLYISRISYVRPGEASFVDHTVSSHYQAWYSVHYYRFFRFFADGTVLYVNTPDEPSVLVPRLRSSQSAQNRDQQHAHVLFGNYQLSVDGSSVVVFLKRDVFRNDQGQRSNRNRRGKKKEGHETLTMELVIRDTRERLHARLDWRRYTITRVVGMTETESVVDVNQHFPSCFFSRVRSYSALAEFPLV